MSLLIFQIATSAVCLVLASYIFLDGKRLADLESRVHELEVERRARGMR